MILLLCRRTTGPLVLILSVAAACGSPAGSNFSGLLADGGVSPGNGGGQGSLATGSSSTGANMNPVGQSCATVGEEESCCGSGTQTCLAAGEFTQWGPCVSATNMVLTCSGVSSDCSASEAKRGCMDGGGPGPDAGVVPSLCTDPSVNTEPGILVAFSPSLGQSVGSHGQIKVWVNDEAAPFIAPNEQVDPSSGAVTAPGNRAAVDSRDGLLWEPAIYLAPQTPLNGGAPHFPDWIKGSYNNSPPTIGPVIKGAPIDAIPSGTATHDKYTAEYVWEVSSMGLSPGQYTAVFVIHDGDTDRGIGCVTMTVEP